jgi:uncharacterized protein YkwD
LFNLRVITLNPESLFKSKHYSLDLKENLLNSRFKVIQNISIRLIFAAILVAGTLTGCSVVPASTGTDTPNLVSSTSASTVIAAPSPTFASGPLYTPAAPQFSPTDAQNILMQYTLDLINSDRQSAGLNPVTLSFNSAAQIHAQDMLDNYYWAHWGTDGLKPYMRYTLEGGLGYDRENVGYSGPYDPAENPNQYADIDVNKEIRDLEYQMVNNDAKSNWGHRDNILYKWHQKVNIGVAFDKKRVALVQQFEGDYVDYIQPPTISGTTLALSGIIRLGEPNNITICYDKSPQPLTGTELVTGNYHSYDLGDRIGYILAPPPPGQFYKDLPEEALLAAKWDTGQSGQFSIQADIAPALSKGKGVYTIVIVTRAGQESINLTNYTIFIN